MVFAAQDNGHMPNASSRTWWIHLATATTLALVGCGGGVTNDIPPAPPVPPMDPSKPFVPSADDLPPAIDQTYVYPEPSVQQLRVRYVPTPVSGPGYYLNADKTCTYQERPPAQTYPAGLVTLDTVNLDESKDDPCEPEINVQVALSGGPFADAKLRVRGSSTRLAEQKSYRIKYSGTDKWMGEDTFQLNKHPWDLSRVRNKLAFDLMRTVPHHPSLSTQFFTLDYTDGTGSTRPMGLFTHVEKMSKSYLARRGWVAGSNVYKAEDFSFNANHLTELGVQPDGSAGPDFEKVLSLEVDAKNHQAMAKLLKNINDDKQKFDAVFTQHFNRNNYLAWLASAILLGNYDTRSQNFGLYQPLGTEKFYFLPWDYDAALGFPDQPGTQNYPEWSLGIGNWWNSALHRRFMQQPQHLELLAYAVQQVRDQYLTDAAVDMRLQSYRPLVERWITSAPDVTYLPTLEPITDNPLAPREWDAEYRRLQQVIATNHRHFLHSLQKPLPFWISPSSTPSGGVALDWGWPQPFHPQGKTITYTVTVAQAVQGIAPFAPETVVLTDTGLQTTQWSRSALPPGNYLVRVQASDADGHHTLAFNEHFMAGQKVFGTVCVRLPSADPC